MSQTKVKPQPKHGEFVIAMLIVCALLGFFLWGVFTRRVAATTSDDTSNGTSTVTLEVTSKMYSCNAHKYLVYDTVSKKITAAGTNFTGSYFRVKTADSSLGTCVISVLDSSKNVLGVLDVLDANSAPVLASSESDAKNPYWLIVVSPTYEYTPIYLQNYSLAKADGSYHTKVSDYTTSTRMFLGCDGAGNLTSPSSTNYMSATASWIISVNTA